MLNISNFIWFKQIGRYLLNVKKKTRTPEQGGVLGVEIHEQVSSTGTKNAV